jgi:hypothetical protein
MGMNCRFPRFGIAVAITMMDGLDMLVGYRDFSSGSGDVEAA